MKLITALKYAHGLLESLADATLEPPQQIDPGTIADLARAIARLERKHPAVAQEEI